MKIIRKIALAELQSLFFSPIAWLIIIVFTIQCLLEFMGIFSSYMFNQDMNYNLSNLTWRIYASSWGGFYKDILRYLYLYVPLLTMNLISRELSSGSINLLYSSPVRNSQIIMGKYLSMLVYGLAMVGILLIPLIYGLIQIENFDLPLALTGLLGFYLLFCTYAAIGLFFSSLTSYQVVAAVGTFVMLALLNNVSNIGQTIDFVRDITYWLNLSGRAQTFTLGLVSSDNLIYFILIIIMFISLSILRLKAIRQRAKGWIVWSKYIAAVMTVFLIGYISSRPFMKVYWDSTRTKQLTLTENSQDVIARAKGPMKITTYVNILDGNFYIGIPKNRNNDLSRFEQYLRFKPDIKMKYVYYYAKPEGSDLDDRFPGLTEKELVGKIALNNRYSGVDSSKFVPVSEIDIKDQLKEENYRFIRLVERGDGQKTFLRIFDDMQCHPSEPEITAALKRIVMDLPVVGFVTGHGERNIDMEGDRGYFLFSHKKTFRYALVNQGFDVEKITLDNPVPPHINIIVIADMRRPMTSEQEANLDAYIARGGNLLIACDIGRQDVMNPVAGRFGVSFLPGQIVTKTGMTVEVSEQEKRMLKTAGISLEDIKPDKYPPDFVVGNMTEEGADLVYIFERIRDREYVITMPGCVAIEYGVDKGFDVNPLLKSAEKDSWNKLEPADFTDDEAEIFIDASIGEKEESLPMGVALSRSISGREQKIIVLGDADCISNGEIGISREGIRSGNYSLILGMFYWLSDEEVPINVTRPPTTDRKLLTTSGAVYVSKIFMIGVFPAMLLATSLIIWLRRRGR